MTHLLCALPTPPFAAHPRRDLLEVLLVHLPVPVLGHVDEGGQRLVLLLVELLPQLQHHVAAAHVLVELAWCGVGVRAWWLGPGWGARAGVRAGEQGEG